MIENDVFSGFESEPITGNVLDNDIDITAVTAGTFVTDQGGSVVLAADGSFTYTPPEFLSGIDNFNYTAAPGQGNGETATVTLNLRSFTPEDLQVAPNPAPIKVGTEFQINNGNTNDQSFSSTTNLDDGGFVVVWHDRQTPNAPAQVYGQRFHPDGTVNGSEFQIANPNNNNLTDAHVATYAEGFMVTWQSIAADGTSAIVGQHFNADGTPNPQFQVTSFLPAQQTSPTIIPYASGDFLIVWQSEGADGDGGSIMAQLLNTDGTFNGAAYQVNTHSASDQFAPAIVNFNDGGFVISWTSEGQDGSGAGIYAQRYFSNGTPQGAEFLINSTTANDQSQPVMTEFMGGFLVTWVSEGEDGSGAGIYGQAYRDNGSTLGNQFQINTNTPLDQLSPAITTVGSDSFVVTWQSELQDGSGFGIFGQRMTVDGTAIGSEFLVNSFTDANQSAPSITTLIDNNNIVVTWQSELQDGDGQGIFAQIFSLPPQNAAATPLIGEVGQPLDLNIQTELATYPELENLVISVSGLPAGATLTNGTDNGDGSWSLTLAQLNQLSIIFAPGYNGAFPLTITATFNEVDFPNDPPSSISFGQPVIIGNADTLFSAGNDVITLSDIGGTYDSGDGDDLITGGARIDYIDGGAGNDNLHGLDSTDHLSGGAGNDKLYGDNGDDILNGGDGIDQLYGDVGNDIMDGGAGSDYIDGGAGDDIIRGGDGDDIIDGGAGQNQIFGDGGNDTIWGRDSVDIIDGGAGIDQILAGDNNDIITGGADNDYLYGQDGDDHVDGGDGNDRVDGGEGDNTLIGGSGNDSLWGGSGVDTIFGNSGIDIVLSGGGNDIIDTGTEADFVWGGDGNDTIHGGDGGDVLIGENGDDTIHGDDGSDLIDGGSGQNTIFAGAGHDTVWGGSDIDTISGGDGNDQILGGGGNDLITGGDGVDYLSGGAGNDIVSGGLSHDILWGYSGNDVLNGDSGVDQIFGGDGNDIISGGADTDYIYGQGGVDVFVFAAGWGADNIYDFVTDSETLDMSAVGTSFDALTLTDLGGVSTRIELGFDTITLHGVSIDSLDANDFVF